MADPISTLIRKICKSALDQTEEWEYRGLVAQARVIDESSIEVKVIPPQGAPHSFVVSITGGPLR